MYFQCLFYMQNFPKKKRLQFWCIVKKYLMKIMYKVSNAWKLPVRKPNQRLKWKTHEWHISSYRLENSVAKFAKTLAKKPTHWNSLQLIYSSHIPETNKFIIQTQKHNQLNWNSGVQVNMASTATYNMHKKS